MVDKHELGGVVPAVATPLINNKLDLSHLKIHLQQLARDGSHGVLLMGTTGEGPSLSLAERKTLIEAAREYTGDMVMMAGTGCASLTDTIELTQHAFNAGADVVVVVPPFYFKGISEEGLLAYYKRLVDEAVPDDGMVILYHIPQVTGVPISFNLLENLLSFDSNRIVGIKDSSGNLEHGRQLCQRFPQLRVFIGDDKLLYGGLKAGAAGCITAGGNLLAPLGAAVYRKFVSGGDATEEQARLTAARVVLEDYRPFPVSIKRLLAVRYGTGGWEVCPPLVPLSDADLESLVVRLADLDLSGREFDWLSESGSGSGNS